MSLLALLGCPSEPVDGALLEGIYGSPDLGLRVDADGAATFERSCWRGELGVVTVSDGALDAGFDWVRTGGDPPDSAEAPTPATLSATVTETRIVGTITSEGDVTDIDLTFGEEPTYFECP